MIDISAESRREPEISATGPGSDAPLWLLQTDETRPLYLSFILSVTVHIILFAVMAATRIFHPFAGASQEFDLVWFSPTPTAAPMVSPPAKPSSSKPGKLRTAQIVPTAKRSAPAITPVTKESPPPAPAKTETAPANNPPQPSPAAAQVQTAKEVPIEEPSEMVISRYSGKVVEVVDKKGDIPTFTVMSSVMKKSLEARAVVKTIRETDKIAPKQGEARQKTKPSEGTLVAALPKEGSAENRGEAIAIKPVSTSQTSQNRSGTSEKPTTPTASASTAAVGPEEPSNYTAVNRSINSFAAALGSLSASGNNQSGNAPAQQGQRNGSTAAGKDTTLQENGSAAAGRGSTLQHSSDVATPSRPVTVEKPASVAETQPTQPPPSPQLILHPPVTGDLKLVITGDVDVKVDVFFRSYAKSRRSKPWTRWEAQKRRSILPKVIRTGKNVHEAVVEITEEGIYTIVVRPDNGNKGTAELVLKIRESRPGATTKKLGSRKIDETFEVARILMPDGILWDDDKYFSGDMEDSDSITKFHTGTGLMWREYK
jgi:hypothetical protein